MPEAAVRCVNVWKSYPLYDGPVETALDRLGLGALARLRRGQPIPTFVALQGIDIDIRKGERVGVVGRNGAGKTSLLKLITGNFLPTSGDVAVAGTVQALLGTGVGFHPEFSGYENLRSALHYNGLAPERFEEVLADAVAFSELGGHLHQPVRTYSLGMRARLQFAAATAVDPDILIIDEVLGAGDTYFAGKSFRRVQRLAESGCTLILVSHSMQQVLQFCRRAIWLEAGRVAMDGDALSVVRAYEEFSRRLDHAAELAGRRGGPEGVLDDEELKVRLLAEVRESAAMADDGVELDARTAPRWPAEEGIRIVRLRLCDGQGFVTREIRAGAPATLEMEFERCRPAVTRARFAIVAYRDDGQVATRLISDEFPIAADKGTVSVHLPEAQFGAGVHVLSAAIYKRLDLEHSSDAVAYDLISRCFRFSVLPAHPDDPSLFHMRQVWTIGDRRQ